MLIDLQPEQVLHVDDTLASEVPDRIAEVGLEVDGILGVVVDCSAGG